MTLDFRPFSIEIGEKPGIWKYSRVLPSVEDRHKVSLGESSTPLQKSHRIERKLRIGGLWIKDETMEPTGSYLDRSSATFVSIVLSLGFSRILTYSTGNLGASLAAYSSKAGLKMHVHVKPTIDLGKLYQMLVYGAEVSVVDSFRRKRWARNAAVAVEYDPFINEAKKTIMLEIFLQLSQDLPDYVILPMGEGGLAYATFKMMNELKETGALKRRIGIIGVQTEDCKPIVRAFEKGLSTVEAEAGSRSKIFDLNVASPRFGDAALRAIRETGGLAVSVGEREIFEALSALAEKEGVFAEPAGSLPMAGLMKLAEENELRDSRVVCIITGSGLKDPKVMREIAHRKSSLGTLIEELSGGYRLGQTKMAILRLLSEGGIYGYRIWKGLEERYGIKVKIPTVYQHLEELVRRGYVKKGASKTVMGRRREYYSLTERGEALV